MNLPFRWRLFVSYVALIAATALIVSSLVTRRLTSQSLADIEARLGREAQMLAEVAGDKFEWMEGKFGERISREVWLR